MDSKGMGRPSDDLAPPLIISLLISVEPGVAIPISSPSPFLLASHYVIPPLARIRHFLWLSRWQTRTVTPGDRWRRPPPPCHSGSKAERACQCEAAQERGRGGEGRMAWRGPTANGVRVDGATNQKLLEKKLRVSPCLSFSSAVGEMHRLESVLVAPLRQVASAVGRERVCLTWEPKSRLLGRNLDVIMIIVGTGSLIFRL
jgi:hypothetical protein